jgi:tetratricopeptide (TPR) repeat protein
MSKNQFRRLKTACHPSALVLLGILALSCCVFELSGAETDAPPAPGTAAKPEETNSTETLRSYLQLQEQMHGLQLAIEENRKQADAAAARNAASVAERLQSMEQSLAIQRARDLDTVRNSNRLMLLVAGTFCVVGLLAMMLMAYQWRTVGRLAELSSLPPRRLLGPGTSLERLAHPEGPLLGIDVAEQSNRRLIGALDRLEKRIFELEQSGYSPLNTLGPANHNSQTDSALPVQALAGAAPTSGAVPDSGPINLKVGKGQSLLNLDRPEEALACFEEVLAVEPAHTEALLKKAAALERLRKLPEAIDCYDRAIAADGSLTIAYLYKGGLFNRMERYGEALECYEKALRAQDKSA